MISWPRIRGGRNCRAQLLSACSAIRHSVWIARQVGCNHWTRGCVCIFVRALVNETSHRGNSRVGQFDPSTFYLIYVSGGFPEKLDESSFGFFEKKVFLSLGLGSEEEMRWVYSDTVAVYWCIEYTDIIVLKWIGNNFSVSWKWSKSSSFLVVPRTLDVTGCRRFFAGMHLLCCVRLKNIGETNSRNCTKVLIELKNVLIEIERPKLENRIFEKRCFYNYVHTYCKIRQQTYTLMLIWYYTSTMQAVPEFTPMIIIQGFHINDQRECREWNPGEKFIWDYAIIARPRCDLIRITRSFSLRQERIVISYNSPVII